MENNKPFVKAVFDGWTPHLPNQDYKVDFDSSGTREELIAMWLDITVHIGMNLGISPYEIVMLLLDSQNILNFESANPQADFNLWRYLTDWMAHSLRMTYKEMSQALIAFHEAEENDGRSA